MKVYIVTNWEHGPQFSIDSVFTNRDEARAYVDAANAEAKARRMEQVGYQNIENIFDIDVFEVKQTASQAAKV